MTRSLVGSDCFRSAGSAAPPWGFARRLSAALSRRCRRWLESNQFRVKGKVKSDGQECPSHTSHAGLCPVDSRGRLSPHAPQGLKPGALFLRLCSTTGSRALPGLSRGWFVERSSDGQQQVPHRAFGPVRNDKVSFEWLFSRRWKRCAAQRPKSQHSGVEMPCEGDGTV